MEQKAEYVIERAEEAVERATKTTSQQPRFAGNVDSIFGALYRWVKLTDDLAIPDYSSKSRRRDAWLQEFWLREPHWAGIVSQLSTISAGRGWQLTGGRNQVRRYTDILHEAEDGAGWREYLKKQVISYYTSDLGALTECGRDGQGGPLRALFHVDPARCELTGDPEAPLKYYPGRGRLQPWGPDDFFRVAANPSPAESFNGLGFCATSMAFDLVKMLYGIWMHDQEKVGARMPQGIMLLDGVSEEQWSQAIRARKADLDAQTRAYFGGLYVFFNEGLEQMDYKLIALSQLPPNFDRQTFIDQTMYGYALIVGMDPSEFWPVQFGSLGRGRETEIQHRKALSKGASEFALAYQEQLQKELPDTLLFEFEERDTEGELLDAELAQAWADAASVLAGGKTGGVPLVDPARIASWLVEKGVWPEEWTPEVEESVATDTEEARSRDEVRRAAESFPDEPIVRYRWRNGVGLTTTLWPSGSEALRRRVWPVARQDNSEVLYRDPGGDFTITQADVDKAMADGRRRGLALIDLCEAPLDEEAE